MTNVIRNRVVNTRCLACTSILKTTQFYCSFCTTFGKVTGQQQHKKIKDAKRNKIYYKKNRQAILARTKILDAKNALLKAAGVTN